MRSRNSVARALLLSGFTLSLASCSDSIPPSACGERGVHWDDGIPGRDVLIPINEERADFGALDEGESDSFLELPSPPFRGVEAFLDQDSPLQLSYLLSVPDESRLMDAEVDVLAYRDGGYSLVREGIQPTVAPNMASDTFVGRWTIELGANEFSSEIASTLYVVLRRRGRVLRILAPVNVFRTESSAFNRGAIQAAESVIEPRSSSLVSIDVTGQGSGQLRLAVELATRSLTPPSECEGETGRIGILSFQDGLFIDGAAVSLPYGRSAIVNVNATVPEESVFQVFQANGLAEYNQDLVCEDDSCEAIIDFNWAEGGQLFLRSP